MSRIRPAMEDSRAFTSYDAACVLDSTLAYKYSKYGPEYRSWLQHDAKTAYMEMRKLKVCSARPCFLLPYPLTNAPAMRDPQDPAMR
jgi:hypothetical protein